MINIDCEYRIKEDIEFIIETEKINKLELSKKTGISRVTLDGIAKNGTTIDSVYEKFYSYVYDCNYRINAVKEENFVSSINKKSVRTQFNKKDRQKSIQQSDKAEISKVNSESDNITEFDNKLKNSIKFRYNFLLYIIYIF